ncbi:MAG: discoidin domain-containing protein, partial [Proteobacteria bacterium]|nr:discoidin domain-containing protein [Pseudomonadota bacterium]
LGANLWNAQSAIDGNMETAWMVPGESTNRGEWIKFDVPKSTLDAVRIYPGWGRSEKDFNDYARVKQLKVEVLCCLGEDEKLIWSGNVDVKDEQGWQTLDVENTPVGSDFGMGGWVKLSVVDIYDGRDYPNLAVSEVVLQLEEYDTGATISSVSDESDAHMSLDMLDDDTRTYWEGDAAGATIVFATDGHGVSSVGIQARSNDYDRPKKVRITANDRVIESELPDSLDEHSVEIPPVVGYTGSAWGDIQLEVLETYPGSKHAGRIAISELNVKATNYDGI